ncbi:MAG TPA: hypothetical protein PKJ56_09530, partial [Promineifilum sp.]|nr:hypothetical protein [Promineifilum sp.]
INRSPAAATLCLNCTIVLPAVQQTNGSYVLKKVSLLNLRVIIVSDLKRFGVVTAVGGLHARYPEVRMEAVVLSN